MIKNIHTEISNSFNKYATKYDQAAKIQQEVGQRLFDRLDYLKIKPQSVLDLGCGTGCFLWQLKKRYPRAKVIGLDIAKAMLLVARKKQKWWWSSCSMVNGTMLALPFVSGAFDLIFANQAIHWSTELRIVIRELNRILNNNGCLIFSTMGPGSLPELKHAWQAVDKFAHVNEFIDMHDIGDYLLQEHFYAPIVDAELLTIRYTNLKQLLHDLKTQGVRNINQSRNPGLTGRKIWETFSKAYNTQNGKYSLTYEVIYGNAWKGVPMVDQASDKFETFIPIDKIYKQSDL